MSSLNRSNGHQSLAHPTTVTPHPALRGKNVFDVLPNELTGASLDYLLPHKQLGFARASVAGLALSNQSVAPCVPFPARVTDCRALEWTRRFQDLAPEIQEALESTNGLLPCPDIFSLINENTQDLHIQLAKARERASRGIVTGTADSMVNALYYAKQFAEKAGVPMPDTADIEKEGYANAGFQAPA